MLAESFRLVTARLIPRRGRRKQALVLCTVILAGCGGGGQGNVPAVRVTGPGFSFAAPKGWKIEHAAARASATHDAEIVQVAAFPLARAYTDALFGKVKVELAARMRVVAAQSGGTLSDGGTVTVAGIRSHAYRVTGKDHVDEYTFVLRAKREFQLLCRRRSSSADTVCKRLLTSFRVA
jgi:hypothetical protein